MSNGASEVIDEQEFTTLEELVYALDYWKNFIKMMDHHASAVFPVTPGRLELIEETLTDGSKVLNFRIG